MQIIFQTKPSCELPCIDHQLGVICLVLQMENLLIVLVTLLTHPPITPATICPPCLNQAAAFNRKSMARAANFNRPIQPEPLIRRCSSGLVSKCQ